MQYKLECMVKLRTSWDILITAKSLQMYITINNLEAFCYITNQLLQKYSIWKKQKGFAIFFGAWEILNDKNIIRKWALSIGRLCFFYHLEKLHKTSEMQYKFRVQIFCEATHIYAPVLFFLSNWVWAISWLLHTFICNELLK